MQLKFSCEWQMKCHAKKKQGFESQHFEHGWLLLCQMSAALQGGDADVNRIAYTRNFHSWIWWLKHFCTPIRIFNLTLKVPTVGIVCLAKV